MKIKTEKSTPRVPNSLIHRPDKMYPLINRDPVKNIVYLQHLSQY